MPKRKSDDEYGLNAEFHYPEYDGNEETVEEVLSKRRKTGGRVAGTPNKEKKFDVVKIARQYGLRAIATVVEVMEDEEESGAVRLAAANSLLDRGFGRAKQTVEHSGLDGEDIQHRLVIEFVGQPPVITNNHINSDSASLHNTFVVNPGERSPDVQAIGSEGLVRRGVTTAAPEPTDLHPLTAARMRQQTLSNQPQALAQNVTEVLDVEQVVVPQFKKPWE